MNDFTALLRRSTRTHRLHRPSFVLALSLLLFLWAPTARAQSAAPPASTPAAATARTWRPLTAVWVAAPGLGLALRGEHRELSLQAALTVQHWLHPNFALGARYGYQVTGVPAMHTIAHNNAEATLSVGHFASSRDGRVRLALHLTLGLGVTDLEFGSDWLCDDRRQCAAPTDPLAPGLHALASLTAGVTLYADHFVTSLEFRAESDLARSVSVSVLPSIGFAF